MLSSQTKAYEGKENYIFISYAHKDSSRVFPIMEELFSRGYRLWYDEGIAPGSEWPEDIAQHLNGAAMVIAFVSANSMASVNCRREINFALSKEKPFLSVVLEPTEMPLGMELQLSAQQSVLRHNYTSEAAFLEKICACPGLSQCQQESIPASPVMDAATPQGNVPVRKHNRRGIVMGCAALIVAVVIGIILFAGGGSGDKTKGKETITVYAQLPDTWKAGYCWAWGESGDVYDAWPGGAMEADGDWYTIELPDWASGVVISNGQNQTEDIPLREDTDLWVIVGEEYYDCFYEDPTKE